MFIKLTHSVDKLRLITMQNKVVLRSFSNTSAPGPHEFFLLGHVKVNWEARSSV